MSNIDLDHKFTPAIFFSKKRLGTDKGCKNHLVIGSALGDVEEKESRDRKSQQLRNSGIVQR